MKPETGPIGSPLTLDNKFFFSAFSAANAFALLCALCASAVNLFLKELLKFGEDLTGIPEELIGYNRDPEPFFSPLL